jgi:glyceraldehyde 3-phosphate dehydrogenase
MAQRLPLLIADGRIMRRANRPSEGAAGIMATTTKTVAATKGRALKSTWAISSVEHSMVRVAINGLGRIGRATLKIVIDTPGLDLVAANDIGAPDSIAYLLKYDTVYGRYEKTVGTGDDGTLTIGKRRLTLLREEDPSRLPWASLNVDIVFECTGAFTRRQDLDGHIRAGARYVILSAPSKNDDVETIVHGVNTPQGATAIISCASCTTNCITPVMEILGRRIGVQKAIMTTVHAYTASQAIVDAPLAGYVI